MAKKNDNGKHPGGRPAAIDQKQLEIFKSVVNEYPYSTDAELYFMFEDKCKEEGLKDCLSYRTFQDYKSKPESYKNNIAYELIEEFSHVIKKAQIIQKNKLVKGIEEGDQGWQAKAWISERKFTDWNLKHIAEIDHTTKGESLNDISKLTTEELIKRAEAAKKIEGES